MSVTPFRWGILGAGGIAEQFTRDVLRLEDHRVVAVGSRTQVKADAFADKFAIGHRHDSYQKLVNEDPYSKPWNLLFYTCLGFALWAWGIIYF